MAVNSPICICVKDNERIIDAQILHAEKENGFKIEESENKIIINFDFIAKNQGIVLKIFHTGEGDDNLRLTGTFNDGRKISEKGHSSSRKMISYHSMKNFRLRKIYRILQITLIVVMAIFSVTAIYLLLTQDNETINRFFYMSPSGNNNQIIQERTFIFVFSCLYLILSTISLFGVIKKSHHKMPKEIERVFEGINKGKAPVLFD